jgi:asparagine synthase (glutamine-hydrolysing)
MQLNGFVSYKKSLLLSGTTASPSDSKITWGSGFLCASANSFTSIYADSKFLLSYAGEVDRPETISNFNWSNPQLDGLFHNRLKGELAETIALGAIYLQTEDILVLCRALRSDLPVYYVFVPDSFFAFSTSLVSLLQTTDPYVKFNVSQNRIADYSLFGRDNSVSYDSETFFSEIRTLLPGHILKVSSSGTSLHRNVTFDTRQYEGIHDLQSYGEIFKSHFLESVKLSCGDNSLNLGANLSGGLDSSSICSAVKYIFPDRPIQTFYYDVGDTDKSDEEYSLEVSGKLGTNHHIITPSYHDFEIISRLTGLYGYPEHVLVPPSLTETLLKNANKLNCDVLLSGHGGDNVVGSGLEIIEGLFNSKSWESIKPLLRNMINYASVANEYRNWENFDDDKKYSLLLQRFLYKRLSSKLRNVGLKEGISLAQEVNRAFPVSYKYFAKSGAKSLLNKLNFFNSSLDGSLLTRDFTGHSAVIAEQNLVKNLHVDLPEDYKQWFDDVFTKQSGVFREQMFTLGNHYNISNRFPFFYKKLFEICMCIPLATKFGQGKGREHFREAMKGILLEKVRTRHSKGLIGSYGRDATLRLVSQAREFIFDNGDIWEFYDKKKYINTVNILKSKGQPQHIYNRAQFQITHAVSLAIWLNWFKSREYLNK